MRANPFLLTLLVAGVSGCDQQQTQMLAQRTEFERQLQDKDKTIAELSRQNTELKVSQASVSPDKLAEAVTESVSKRIEEQNAASFGEMKSQLDEIVKTMKSGASGPPQPVEQKGHGKATPLPPPQPNSGDQNRQHYKLDFGPN